MSSKKEGLNETKTYTEKDIELMQWKKCRKTTLTKARVLTQQDFKEMGGIIETLEGPGSFEAGDYLAIGVDGESYPIAAETMAEIKEKVGKSDLEGFDDYKPTVFTNAIQIHKSFAIIRDRKRYEGKPGDFLFYRKSSSRGIRMSIVDQEIFRKTYEFKND